MAVCKQCKHLIDPSEVHECPSEEYTQRRNQLVEDAAMAEKIFTDDELESLRGIKKEFGTGYIYTAMWGGFYRGRQYLN